MDSQVFGPDGKDPRITSRFSPPPSAGGWENPLPNSSKGFFPPVPTTQFETGAVRDTDKSNVQYHLISPIGLRRVAETYAEGTAKYGLFNWEKGMPIGDILNHAIAHIYAYLEGKKTGEDDLAHAAWNLLAAMHIEETHPHIEHQLRPCHPMNRSQIPIGTPDKD